MADEKQKALADIQSDFENADEEFEEEIVGELKTDPPEEPDFPYLIMFAAMVKDALDIASGGLLTWLFSAFLGLVLWQWFRGKLPGVQRVLLKWGVKRALVYVGLDAIPWVGMIPFASTFVVLAHNKEKKIVQFLLLVLEKIRKGGL